MFGLVAVTRTSRAADPWRSRPAGPGFGMVRQVKVLAIQNGGDRRGPLTSAPAANLLSLLGGSVATRESRAPLGSGCGAAADGDRTAAASCPPSLRSRGHGSETQTTRGITLKTAIWVRLEGTGPNLATPGRSPQGRQPRPARSGAAFARPNRITVQIVPDVLTGSAAAVPSARGIAAPTWTAGSQTPLTVHMRLPRIRPNDSELAQGAYTCGIARSVTGRGVE